MRWRTGTLRIDAGKIAPFAEEMFLGLLRIRFRNVHAVIHHPSENFVAGMPTDLAFRFAGRQAVFRFLVRERGDGWCAKAEMRDHYAQHDAGVDPFNWIRVHPLMSKEVTAVYPFDHAGVGETSLMLALAPEVVKMDRVSENRGIRKGRRPRPPSWASVGWC